MFVDVVGGLLRTTFVFVDVVGGLLRLCLLML